ncbi:MAG: GNAT family N-acetyltransferase [Sedimentisphaerales bacterium]|nr:GNAT family N-acetyltransferase [Sedimentisphaerales bacterium]
MPRRKTSVLVLYNSPKKAYADQTFAESEAGVLAEVQAVEKALSKLRIAHRTVGIRAFEELAAALSASDETVVFNLVEGFWENAEQANLVPSVVRSFGKACTGNDTRGLLLSLDKWQSKNLLVAAGLPVPKGLLVHPGQSVPVRELFEGPYIVKPVGTDASEGIDRTSVIRKPGRALRDAVRRIHDRWSEPALIEQYIEGRELNISVIGRDGAVNVLPLAEIDFSAFEADRPRIVGYEAKWLADSFEYHNTPRVIPAPLPKRLAERIRALAKDACRALSCEHYCRVDFRLDRANRPYVLEVNANPDISPDAGFAAAIEAAGMSYEAFVKLTIDNALARGLSRISSCRGHPRPRVARASCPRFEGETPSTRRDTRYEIRWCQPSDRQIVLSFLAETGFFRPDEIETAREVLDAALAEGPQGHYQSFVACVNRESDCGLEGTRALRRINPKSEIRNPKSLPVGWVCFGPTPCTIGSFDVYWIGVAPSWQGRGIGGALTAFAEKCVAERGGRLIVIETSSREVYLPTRRFYEKLGYAQVARVRDFYGRGDDRVIFTKGL